MSSISFLGARVRHPWWGRGVALFGLTPSVGGRWVRPCAVQTVFSLPLCPIRPVCVFGGWVSVGFCVTS